MVDMLSTQGWADLGAIASTWGGEDLVPTCLTARSNQPTRRDYIFANRFALPLVMGFKVILPHTCHPPCILKPRCTTIPS